MENNNKISSRRSFLKIAAYAVPAVVALGQITNPVKSSAASFVGGGTSSSNSTPVPNTGNDAGNARTIFKVR